VTMNMLICGAGIAGPTLAYWCRRAGHQVTLVERAPQFRRGGYVIDFWGAGFEVAERMGIVPELCRRGYLMREARAVDRQGRRVASITPSAVMGSNERYVSIGRSDLAAVVTEALDDDVELVLGDSVRTIDDRADSARVTLESGQIHDVDLVVGADGLHSRIRRLSFGRDETFQRDLGIVVAAFEVDGYRPRDELVAMMHAEVGFQVLRLSLHEDRTLFLISARHDGPVPTEDRPAQEALLRSTLAGAGWETPAILEAMPQAQTFYFDSVSQIRMPSWSRGRVALVGDAAACPSFLAGQGSALAMVEAYTLAAELARSHDHYEAFARYQARLSPLLQSKQDAAVGLAAAFAPKSTAQLFIRNTVMRLMALPKVADLAMGRSFRDAVQLPPFVDAA
jgi:2-polyprenyl-6-methoxyphenol hydroxylase-like FAD-dependent oxidoreductase